MKRSSIFTLIVVVASGIAYANPCLGFYTEMHPDGVAGATGQDMVALSINESMGSLRMAQVPSGPQGYGTVPAGWGVPSGYSPVPAWGVPSGYSPVPGAWGVPSGYGPAEATEASQGAGATGTVTGGSTLYQGPGSSSKPGASKQ